MRARAKVREISFDDRARNELERCARRGRAKRAGPKEFNKVWDPEDPKIIVRAAVVTAHPLRL
jgi:hypothetical protein